MKAKVQMRQVFFFFFKWRTMLFPRFACMGQKRDTGTKFFTLQKTSEFPVSVLWTAWLFYRAFTVKAWALGREVLAWETSPQRARLIAGLGVWCSTWNIFFSRALLQVFLLHLGQRWQLHVQCYSWLHGLPRKGSCWLGNLHDCLISLWLGARW